MVSDLSLMSNNSWKKLLEAPLQLEGEGMEGECCVQPGRQGRNRSLLLVLPFLGNFSELKRDNDKWEALK